MEIAPTLTSVVYAQRELTLKQLGINARQSVQAAQVRALDRLILSESHAPTRNRASVPTHPTRGRNVDMYA